MCIIIQSKYFAFSDWLKAPANSSLTTGVYNIRKMIWRNIPWLVCIWRNIPSIR